MIFKETKFNVGDTVFAVVLAPRVDFDTGCPCRRCDGQVEWCGLCDPNTRSMIYPVDNFMVREFQVEGVAVSMSKWYGGPHERYTLAFKNAPWEYSDDESVFATHDEANSCAVGRFELRVASLKREFPNAQPWKEKK